MTGFWKWDVIFKLFVKTYMKLEFDKPTDVFKVIHEKKKGEVNWIEAEGKEERFELFDLPGIKYSILVKYAKDIFSYPFIFTQKCLQ